MTSSIALPNLLALSGGVIAAIVIGSVIVIILLWALAVYNGLVRKRQACKESWSDIDTELKRRHDLIPNLVSTVKGYATHEANVLEQVTSLRNEAVELQGKTAADRGHVEGELQASLGKLIARVEAYPDLKASANFLELQKELSDTETRIARARRFYNANVRDFHNGCQLIPSSMVAAIGGFKTGEFDFFQVDDASEQTPADVSFSDAGERR